MKEPWNMHVPFFPHKPNNDYKQNSFHFFHFILRKNTGEMPFYLIVAHQKGKGFPK